MKIEKYKFTRYRFKKAYQCYVSYIKRGGHPYWTFRLAMWWFSAGFEFEGDK